MSALAPAEVKACCAAAYAGPAARWLLGDGFHPGGAALTSRLARALAVRPEQTVVDVASGRGTSALQVARETGCRVVGVDLSPESVEAASRLAAGAGLGDRVRFLVGDAEALPLPDASADGVLCECALCTFPDKAAAVRELARVLRPGARLALSDVTADPGRLPEELTGVAAWVACLGGAEPLGAIAGRLAGAGLELEAVERHDRAFAELLEDVRVRLGAARTIGGALPEALRGRLDRGLSLVDAAQAALEGGALGYGVVVARRP